MVLVVLCLEDGKFDHILPINFLSGFCEAWFVPGNTKFADNKDIRQVFTLRPAEI